MQKLPKARTENLVENDLGKEILLYDLLVDKAYNLNETLTIVYRACDGKQSFDELKRNHDFSDELIYLALDELRRNALLADGYISPFAGMNRREVIKKVGLASAVALPVILGLTAPKAANAASGAIVCIDGAACDCSTPNNSGSTTTCGLGLGGISVNCGSSIPDDGCDCVIPNGSSSGICTTPF